MISNHTKQALPAADLAKSGKLILIGGDSYRHEIPANPNTGVGPMGSYWTAELGEQVINHGVIGQPAHIYVGGQLIHQSTD